MMAMVWTMIYLVGLGAIFSLIFAFYNFNKGTKMEHGTPVMQDIAKAIREGANAFLKREFSIEIPVILGIAVIFGIIFHYTAGLALLLGWQTRWAALALALFTLVASFFFHKFFNQILIT